MTEAHSIVPSDELPAVHTPPSRETAV
ncbi:MAG: hypothetical protein K0R27_5036, partial [Xanthobacteraceae bacterium]|nr:hypothetical protein [Xanthobacteraceae bacterium]